MKKLTVLAALLTLSCGNDLAKGDTNAEPNNIVSNNTTPNNVVTNNMLEDCGPSTGAPERQLGLVGAEISGEVDGVVLSVESDRLDLLINDADAQFFFDGGDLTDLFNPDDEVRITTSSDAEQAVTSIAGPAGVGAEIGWGFGDSLFETLPPSVSLPLSAGRATFGERTSSETCLVDSLCGDQERTSEDFNLAVTYRGETHELALGADLTDDEYSFRNLGAGTTGFQLIETDDGCVAEGGTGGSLVVSAWGRVFL